MPQKNKSKILIIDDDADIRDIYSMLLSAQSFLVITAADGEDGLKKAIAESPDLILLDVSMPVMDGFTMLQKLRAANDYGKNAKIIFLTNLNADREDTVKKVVETRPISYIVKSSISNVELLAKIKEALTL